MAINLFFLELELDASLFLSLLAAANPTLGSSPGAGRGGKELRPHGILGGPDALQRLPQPGFYRAVTGDLHTPTHTPCINPVKLQPSEMSTVLSEDFHWFPWERSRFVLS